MEFTDDTFVHIASSMACAGRKKRYSNSFYKILYEFLLLLIRLVWPCVQFYFFQFVFSFAQIQNF